MGVPWVTDTTNPLTSNASNVEKCVCVCFVIRKYKE